MKYKIKKEQAGIRLDKFLTEKLKNKSRTEIQKIIQGGSVSVSGKKSSKHSALKEGEVVEVIRKKEKTKEKKQKNFKIEIVFENNDFLVINKPAGLIAHSASYIKQATLTDWLLQKYPKLKNVGENKNRPGIVHRLDKEASGLMVIAKNNKTFAYLKKQFQDRLVEKEYQALVYGAVSKEGDVIDFSIKRAAAGYRQAALPEQEDESRPAFTEFRVMKRWQNYTLLRVKIKTGRKHQIRVHLYAYGHPIVGDDLYSTSRTKLLNKKIGLDRIFLAAVFLAFFDSSGQRHKFSLGLPPELEEFLEKLK